MKPLRIAHISTPRSFRGGENQVLILLRGLATRGMENVLFTPGTGLLAAKARGEGFPVSPVPLRFELDVLSVLRVARELRRLRPDVVQFHDAHAVMLGGLACALAGIKARVGTRRVDYPLRSPWKWRRFCGRVIAISAVVRDVLVADRIPASRVRIVPSAVNTARFEKRDALRARRTLGLEQGRPLIVCPAALTAQKDHANLLEAIPRFHREFPQALVLLVGEGELEKALRKQASELGLGEDRLRFLGWRDDVPDLLAASDLFVMPSRFEGLCSAALEAMWCGVPVVTTDAGGLPEAVGDCGRLVPAGNPQALAEAMMAALRNPEESRRLAQAAAARARTKFGPDSMVEGTLAVYRELGRS